MSTHAPKFSQLHIDAARYASDDFNLFHDAVKWRKLRDNPFQGPIVLGFQTECWLTEALRDHLQQPGIAECQQGLRFSNLHINFVGALKPDQSFELTVKKAKFDADQGVLSQRVLIKSRGNPVLMGYHRLSRQPLVLADQNLEPLPDLKACHDRSQVPGTSYFLKRKFMMTANAKNFLLGSLVDPGSYFDELEDRVEFPEIFPVSYISCALLERAQLRGHDFEAEPMVYTQHQISLDRSLVQSLKSNDALHILVTTENAPSSAGVQSRLRQENYRCFGLVENKVLFRARISLAPLAEVIKAHRRN